MSNILDGLLSSDAYTPVNKVLAINIGFITAGYFGELIRQRKRFGNEEFFFSQPDMEKMTGISKYQQRKANAILIDMGFISIIKKGVPCKNYFKIHDVSVVKKLDYWQSKKGTTSSKKSELQEGKKTNHSCNKKRNKKRNNNTSKEVSVCNTSKNKKDNIKETTTKVYGKKEINDIIAVIKQYNNNTHDGTFDENRRYANLLIRKLDKIPGFTEKVDGNYGGFVENLIIGASKYNQRKVTSTKGIYYNLASLIKDAKEHSMSQGDTNTKGKKKFTVL